MDDAWNGFRNFCVSDRKTQNHRQMIILGIATRMCAKITVSSKMIVGNRRWHKRVESISSVHILVYCFAHQEAKRSSNHIEKSDWGVKDQTSFDVHLFFIGRKIRVVWEGGFWGTRAAETNKLIFFFFTKYLSVMVRVTWIIIKRGGRRNKDGLDQ